MMQNAGKCKLCGKTEKLVKSHIVPKALHLDAQNGEAMRIYQQDKPSGQQNSSGVYGRFLCQCCEKSFSQYDNYGVNFVKKYKDGTAGDPLCGSFQEGFTVDVDYATLKLWVMSMLWRADASDHELYKRVNLREKWRNTLAESIRSRTPGCRDYFAVTATLFDEGAVGRCSMADPHPEKHSGVNYYRFYIYDGFTFLVKVDRRKQPKELEPLSLSVGKPFAVMRRKFSKGEEKLLKALGGAEALGPGPHGARSSL